MSEDARVRNLLFASFNEQVKRGGVMGLQDMHSSDRVDSGPTKTLYHQTDEDAARAILSSQAFHLGRDGWAGGGIYFAESPAETNPKAHKRGVILRAQVRLGKTLTVDSSSSHGDLSYDKITRRGYDSVCIPARTGREYVVYYSGQISNIQRV